MMALVKVDAPVMTIGDPVGGGKRRVGEIVIDLLSCCVSVTVRVALKMQPLLASLIFSYLTYEVPADAYLNYPASSYPGCMGERLC